MKVTFKDFVAPDALCPRCGYHFDRATNILGTHKPTPGDLTLCLNCGVIAMFGDDLKPVEAPEGVLKELTPTQRGTMLLMQQVIVKRGPIMKKENVI